MSQSARLCGVRCIRQRSLLTLPWREPFQLNRHHGILYGFAPPRRCLPLTESAPLSHRCSASRTLSDVPHRTAGAAWYSERQHPPFSGLREREHWLSPYPITDTSFARVRTSRTAPPVGLAQVLTPPRLRRQRWLDRPDLANFGGSIGLKNLKKTRRAPRRSS